VIFGDLRFLLMLGLCWVSFFALPVDRRPFVLTAWGVVFYAVYAGAYLPLAVGLVLATYLVCRGRADVLLAGLIALLFIRIKLGVDVTGVALTAPLPGAALIVPLGFSFLAFELLHVAVEHRRGRLDNLTLVDLAAFAFFFPCRIAGPIKRYPAFMAAIKAAQPSLVQVYEGGLRIAIGFFKKFVLADSFALIAGEISYAETPLHAWKAMLAYSLEIYLDFSAYSDMAIGASRVLGIEVPENFNWPYFSRNIQEFWTRWHMSLSNWARDYVFSPTGRQLFKTPLKTSPTVIAALSYGATFLVIGAWHGLTLGYLAWGLYHGLLVTGYYVYRAHVPAAVARHRLFESRLVDVAGAGVTFLLVTIGWVPFVVDTRQALPLLWLMLGGNR
jgi:alginate O-acetyltransferase complex protein AlgI